MDNGATMPDEIQFLRLPEVCARTALKKSQLYVLQQRREFPAPIKVGKTSVWALHEVQAWMRQRLEARERTDG